MSSDKLRDAACLRDIPQLVTEGVSEYLTDYQRPGYTEDALRQFVVLDDIETNKVNQRVRQDEDDGDGDDSPDDRGDEDDDDEDDDDDDDGSMSEGSSEDDGDDSDVPLEEVDMMLEEGLPEDYKIRGEKLPNGKYCKKMQQNSYINRRLQVIDEIFSNPFDVLPEGWVRVTHNTGIPIYLHKETRVCTTAPPYFLGPGSARKHRVPLSAIPCLQYRKALEKEKDDKRLKQENEKSENANNAENDSQRENNVERQQTKADSEPPRKKAKTSDNRKSDCSEKENSNEGSEKAADKEEKVSTAVKDEPMGENGEGRTGEEETNAKASEKGDSRAENNEDACPGRGDLTIKNDLIERLKESISGSCPVPPEAPALPKARIETAQENQETQSINHIELREYCQRLFRYRTIDVMRFKTWSERRRFAKVKKKERQLQRPSLPEGTKLITFPIIDIGGEESGTGNRIRKEWIMNPSGKSYVCILHECVQHALKTQPVYEFKDLENPATPYSATVSINKMKYGTGVGTSKRQAKSEAAKATLEVLIPEMREKMNEDVHRGGAGLSRNQHTDLSFFDDIKIQDPRVHEFCAKTTEPSPYTILLTCLKRNFGMGDMDITCEVKMLRHQKNEFTMSVGNHTATVICKNKREGKQRASQAILQAMHPHITSWGSLLRLYGNRSVKTLREKKQEEQEITTLQSRASANSPNWAILNKLKEAMLKLKERNAAVKPLGTFIPPSNVDLPMTSASNLNNLEL